MLPMASTAAALTTPSSSPKLRGLLGGTVVSLPSVFVSTGSGCSRSDESVDSIKLYSRYPCSVNRVPLSVFRYNRVSVHGLPITGLPITDYGLLSIVAL